VHSSTEKKCRKVGIKKTSKSEFLNRNANKTKRIKTTFRLANKPF
jgi:hypothetical protein